MARSVGFNYHLATMKLPGFSLVLIAVWANFPGRSMGQAHYFNVNPEVIQERLYGFKGSDTAREATLLQLFSSAGCQPANLTEQAVHGRHQPNVICILPGSTPATIVVGAHFDHVAAGEGVVDNWSGVSLLPSFFQSLAHSPRTHTYVFVGFTGEEDGLIGSAWYVKHAPPEQLANIEAMINLDPHGPQRHKRNRARTA